MIEHFVADIASQPDLVETDAATLLQHVENTSAQLQAVTVLELGQNAGFDLAGWAMVATTVAMVIVTKSVRDATKDMVKATLKMAEVAKEAPEKAVKLAHELLEGKDKHDRQRDILRRLATAKMSNPRYEVATPDARVPRSRLGPPDSEVEGLVWAVRLDFDDPEVLKLTTGMLEILKELLKIAVQVDGLTKKLEAATVRGDHLANKKSDNASKITFEKFNKTQIEYYMFSNTMDTQITELTRLYALLLPAMASILGYSTLKENSE